MCMYEYLPLYVVKNHWLIHKQIKYEWNNRRRLMVSKVYSQLSSKEYV